MESALTTARPRPLLVALAVSLLSLPLVSSAAVFGPSPYLEVGDSPFVALGLPGFQLESFEDGSFDLPGAGIANGSIVGPGVLADSVDEDDGAVDGSGTGGRSYLLQTPALLSLTFTGSLPTHVGVVWTDVGTTTEVFGVGMVTFRAFDSEDLLVREIGPVMVGDGSAAGGTAEDRFFGIEHAGGIARVEMAMPESADWEIDHVQVAYAPEPDAGGLVGVGLLVAGALRQRRGGSNDAQPAPAVTPADRYA